MKDKHAWMWLGGVAIAAVFFYLSQRNHSQSVNVPYLVPQAQPGANKLPNTDTSHSEQTNIVGSSPNSSIPNGQNPGGVTSANPNEPAGSWNLMPIINPQPMTGTNPGTSTDWQYSYGPGQPQ